MDMGEHADTRIVTAEKHHKEECRICPKLSHLKIKSANIRNFNSRVLIPQTRSYLHQMKDHGNKPEYAIVKLLFHISFRLSKFVRLYTISNATI